MNRMWRWVLRQSCFPSATKPSALKRLAQRLAEEDCARVLIEGGSYQNLLVAALRAAQLPVAIVKPRRVREFANSIGQLSSRIHANALPTRCSATVEHARVLQVSGSGLR